MMRSACGRVSAVLGMVVWTVLLSAIGGGGQQMVAAAEGTLNAGTKLTDDGRIGKVTDFQGIVAVKSVGAERFTPVCEPIVLKPGDWLRTDLRGANAVAARMASDVRITLGPGAVVELADARTFNLAAGELQVAADGETPVTLTGPDKAQVAVKGTAVYRVQADKLVRVERKPRWLEGFEGTVADESIGSLVVNVEGRNVPLTVGYHKVSVDIRDQIARTTIEESFVNHTNGRLEGVFYFPLPQDASISGFGMWIGNELVEADVVEKQRAREIYETILRERRDPGLLEWSGGNLFKARVFPIEARSEKRVKITYTQVLPLRGGAYRYGYALESELLKQHPLRELAIDVRIHSVLPLADVRCPTHLARIGRTEHSARVEFTAQEYTPASDFEVVVQVDAGQSEAVMIPHRRGEDGYFMLMLLPPGEQGAWQRDVLPDGEPLELLILADTSASLDAASRRAQAELVAALLGSLGPRDRFNLAGFDVACDWAFDGPVPADEKNRAAASEFLDARVSLGWTDLDAAVASALEQCGPRTHVVYIGDGIPVTAATDPVAAAGRLRRLYEASGGGASENKATFHAVSVGSRFESVVLKAIASLGGASLGGGSMRQVASGQNPSQVARELLGEMIEPAIRNMKIEFRGLRTARVYPGELPNLAPGTQQILLGRYLPEGKDQEGEVVVTGEVQGQPVRFRAAVKLADAEAGNSFIPRLWARMHLDSLLEQGPSQSIQDEIIAMSEEYHIITPYTSLLVLETDADRERFGVKRRFQMRDGEKFFAEGRDAANYELVQQQMRRAGNWRLGLRRAVLMELAELGRYPELVAMSGPQPSFRPGRMSGRDYSGMGPMSGMGGMGGGIGGGFFGASGDFGAVDSKKMRALAMDSVSEAFAFNGTAFDDGDMKDELSDMSREAEPESQELLEVAAEEAMPMTAAPLGAPATSEPMDADSGWYEGNEELMARKPQSMAGPAAYFRQSSDSRRRSQFARGNRDGAAKSSIVSGFLPTHEGRMLREEAYYRDPQQYTRWLGTLFPGLPAAPVEGPDEKPHPWPVEAREVAQNLLRLGALQAIDGGLTVQRRVESFNARTAELAGVSETLSRVSPAGWVIRSAGGHAHGVSQGHVQWCNEDERGIFSRPFQLGRVRNSSPADLARPPLDLSGPVLEPLDRSYRNYAVELSRPAPERVLLVLKAPGNQDYEVRFLVDKARRVVLTMETRQDGTLANRTKYDQFVELLGTWWATRVETTDGQGRRTSLVTQKFEPLDASAAARWIARALTASDRVQLIKEPLPAVAEAKQAVADGKDAYSDRLALVLHFAESQQWTRVMEHLEASEKSAAGKPGVRFVRDVVLNVARRHEELKARILAEAASLSKARPDGLRDSDRLFLAEYLMGQASGILEANEGLALLDVLRPVYEAAPEHVHAMRRWTEQRTSRLQQTGRGTEALELQRQLATQYRHDHNVQQQYANALFNAGDYAAGYAWLDAALASDRQWHSYEENPLRGIYVQQLRSEGRYEAMATFLETWLRRNPDSSDPYAQYLSALVHTGREDDANRLIEQWLKDARNPRRLDPPTAARLQAAVNQALGRGYNLYTDRIDERWLEPLAETALFLADHPSHANAADTIMTHHHQFQQTDAVRKVRTVVLGRLEDGIGTLAPPVVDRYVNWLLPNDPAVEADTWRTLATALRKRWDAEKDDAQRHQLGATLGRILFSRLSADEHLDFLRAQLDEGPKVYASGYARQLFTALLSQPWRQAYEDEAFGLLDRLAELESRPGDEGASERLVRRAELESRPGDEGASERLVRRVADLHRLTDAMLQARFNAGVAAIERPKDLSRTELRAKREDILRDAREGFAARLRKEMDTCEGAFVQWLNVERLFLEAQLGRELDRVADECWEMLGPKPPRLAPGESADPAEELDQTLKGRCLLTLVNLAARRNAESQLIDRVLAFIVAGMAAEPETEAWRQLKYQLLVALDRPKQLEAALRRWIRPEQAVNHWRLVLGYLLAEQGKVPAAIELFEAIRAADELGPAEYRVLADWYMVVDRREDHEQTLIAVYKTAEEWELNNRLSQHLQPWQRNDGEMPSELSPEVLRILAALLAKSQNPQSYTWQVREFYRNSRDFRLLAGMADAVVGHTAGKVYPFLQSMDTLFSEVREEATVDQIVEHLAVVRRRARTDVDRRALDLLELIIERRAAELLNQPGTHGEKALAAMQRAMTTDWTPGEPRLAADLLAGLDRIAYQPLADEQVRVLETLHRAAERGTDDRLQIAWCLGRTYWSYQRHDDAIACLEAALTEFEQANQGVLPASANNALGTLVDYLESQRHFARGENVLFAQLEHPVTTQQQYWLAERLFQLYEGAIRNDGTVSLGAGQVLYATVERRIRDALSSGDHNHRYRLIERLCNIYREAKRKNLDGVGNDLKAFAFKQLPGVLAGQTHQYQSAVSQVSETLREVIDVRVGLEFLIERIEQEPAWFRLNNQNGWSQFGHSLAYWRTQVTELGELEPRLLRIVLTELRRDVETQQSRNQSMYHRHHSHFWAEKAGDFAATTEAVLAERANSGVTIAYAARYLYHGLDRRDRAIEVMLAAYGRNVLDESGKAGLVDFLQRENRHAESIPILLPLVETRPDNVNYRVQLMLAYFHAEQPAKLRSTLQAAHEHFHAEGRWTETTMALLAYGCLETQLYQQAVDYYREVIAHHQRTRPNRGIGEDALPQYYQWLAQAFAGLGRTADAVDAASGAVVSWGRRHEHREQALVNLQHVLAAAPDLDGFAKELDRQAAETGQENPIVRKALGRVYLEKEEYAKAIAQLELAVAVQPNDRQTHESLIACYDRGNNPQGAIEQLLNLRELAPRDVDLYKQLGERYAKLQLHGQAERAFTSIVEALPEEAESHALLATVRQGQDCWPDAAPHWQRVAQLRALEPQGLLGLAGALVHLERWDAAAEALKKLDAQPWPNRFGNVREQTRALWRQVEAGRAKAGNP